MSAFWFLGLTIILDDGNTILTGRQADQAALHREKSREIGI